MQIPEVPETQTVLLLHAPKERYQVTQDFPVPEFSHDRELLVRTRAIGLNPIDWKAPDFNFGIPELPYISGRELSGDVVKLNKGASRLSPGDKVLVISTDYRDLRKGAYQEYVVSWDFNAVRIPQHLSWEDGATLGVAFVAAALALGVCMGVDFSNVEDGPDLLQLVRQVPADILPADAGDWLAIWGGSATSANLAIQLAKLAGLKVVAVVDKAKHGLRISNHQVIRPDLLVDSHDPQRAVDIIRGNLGSKLRFGFDTRGKDTAAWLLQALSPGNLGGKGVDTAGTPPSPPSTPPDSGLLSSHLIGLTGLPKQTPPEGSVFHTVPIKLFHEVPAIGESLSVWLEKLLEKKLLSPPEIVGIETGLENINSGLDRMRNGEISGGKLVVRLE
ncbi:Zinc-binding dehydrogenase [Pleurostoma richardsiae]|uniref:Zinc-binding dehydrogenase n=1 Tax=Pleurostoma richardsiae TaxID=41990 RepID=A0AA38RH22_9PEZI|nr:Zinc-binding dehydrogenase [Pleurostoma richardsiae]